VKDERLASIPVGVRVVRDSILPSRWGLLLMVQTRNGPTRNDGGDSHDAREISEALTPEQEVRLAVDRWFEPWAQPTALCIVERESGFDPFAVGSAGEVGIGQTHPIHAWAYDWERLRSGDVDYQVGVMHDQARGGTWWLPWLAQKGRCW